MRNLMIAVAFLVCFGAYSVAANAWLPCNATQLASAGIPAVPNDKNGALMPSIGFGGESPFYSFGGSVRYKGAEFGVAGAKCHDPVDYRIETGEDVFDKYTEDLGVAVGGAFYVSPDARVGWSVSKPGIDADFEDVSVKTSFTYSF